MMNFQYDLMARMPRDALFNFVASHAFEWWASFTFEGTVNQELARERLRNWTRKICRMEKMRVAYIAMVEETQTRCHGHLLMIGRNKQDKNLHHVDMAKWAKEWWRINCCQKISWNDGARIAPVYEKSGVSRYLIDHLIPSADRTAYIFYYDKRLLAKCRTDRGLNTPRIIRNTNKKVTIVRRRDGEEYRTIKEKMVSFINALPTREIERGDS